MVKLFVFACMLAFAAATANPSPKAKPSLLAAAYTAPVAAAYTAPLAYSAAYTAPLAYSAPVAYSSYTYASPYAAYYYR